MGRRSRKPKSLKRTSGKNPIKKKLIIVCEGLNTEPDYIEQFKAEKRCDLIQLALVKGAGAPKTIVEKAVEKKKEETIKAKKSQNSFDRNFEVWAVFDRDEHPNIPEAKDQARANNIRIAYSNPCFEIWPLLHFGFFSAPMHRHDLQRKLGEKMPGYDKNKSKSLNYELIKDNYEEAKKNSERLNFQQKESDNFEGNPSTNISDLMDEILNNSRKKRTK